MGAVQMGLFGGESPAFDPTFARLTRVNLGSGAWVDYQPGWVSGHAALFEALHSSTHWRIGEEQIYDRTLPTPRMIALLPDDGPGHPLLEELRVTLSARYAQA